MSIFLFIIISSSSSLFFPSFFGNDYIFPIRMFVSPPPKRSGVILHIIFILLLINNSCVYFVCNSLLFILEKNATPLNVEDYGYISKIVYLFHRKHRLYYLTNTVTFAVVENVRQRIASVGQCDKNASSFVCVKQVRFVEIKYHMVHFKRDKLKQY